jgi:hypothetical protein
MKLFAVIAISVILYATGLCYAAQDLGHPAPFADYGEVSFAFGYHHYASEWKTENPDVLTGELKQNNYWIEGAYTLLDKWEFYARLGLADARIKDLFPFDPPRDFEGDYHLNFSLGLRGLLIERQRWGLGPVFQFTAYSDYEDEKTGTLPPDQDSEEAVIMARYQSWRDIAVGLAAQGNTQYVIFYGGVYGYWTSADGWAEVTPVEENPSRHQAKVEEKNNVGGYVGVRFPFTEAFSIRAEGQYQSKPTLTVAFAYRFGI